MTRKPKPVLTAVTWTVEAPRLGPWTDSEQDFSVWAKDEATARRIFREHIDRVRATHPNMVHFVRLIHTQRTIVEEGA